MVCLKRNPHQTPSSTIARPQSSKTLFRLSWLSQPFTLHEQRHVAYGFGQVMLTSGSRFCCVTVSTGPALTRCFRRAAASAPTSTHQSPMHDHTHINPRFCRELRSATCGKMSKPSSSNIKTGQPVPESVSWTKNACHTRNSR